jgi:RNA recognition motif-containing protein
MDASYMGVPVPIGVTPSPPPQLPYGMNAARSPPNLAAFNVNSGGLPVYGSQSLAALQPINGMWRNGYTPPMIPAADEDVIPTAIVIKNIPFAVSRETLLGVIESLGAPLPYAFNYHHDNGIFRGLAFANFRAPDEAASVVAALNGYDVQGRKLRVEYKKVLQPGEKDKIEREKALKRMRSIQFDQKDTAAAPQASTTGPIPPPLTLRPPNGNGNGNSNGNGNGRSEYGEYSPPHSASSATSENLPVTLDLNDPTALDIYSRVLVFKEDRMRDELAFSRNLTPTERRIVHLVAQKLGLTSITKLDGEIKYVVVTRESPARPTLTTSNSATAPMSSSYLSPYGTTSTELSPSLRIKKSMPDLRGFNGPVVARDPTRSLTPQRSSGNLREGREYVSMGAAQGRRANGGFGSGNFNSFFGGAIGGSPDIPPVPPLPSGLGLHARGNSVNITSSTATASSGLSNGTGNGNGNGSPEGSESAQVNGAGVGTGGAGGPLRNPRGPAGESRGFGGTLRPSASAVLRGSAPMVGAIGRRVSEEDEDAAVEAAFEAEGMRTRESLDL